MWDASTGQEILTLRGQEGSLSPAAFSPDGSRIVTGSDDKTARVWDAVTGTELLVLRGHEGGVVSVAFSPDGSRIVTASHDNTVRLWDAATGREILALGEHSVSLPSARSARFSPDGSRIVTASTDMKARVWDVHFATMATDGLIFEACTRRLRGLSLLSRDEMRLIGEPDDEPPIDVCAGATT